MIVASTSTPRPARGQGWEEVPELVSLMFSSSFLPLFFLSFLSFSLCFLFFFFVFPGPRSAAPLHAATHAPRGLTARRARCLSFTSLAVLAACSLTHSRKGPGTPQGPRRQDPGLGPRHGQRLQLRPGGQQDLLRPAGHGVLDRCE